MCIDFDGYHSGGSSFDFGVGPGNRGVTNILHLAGKAKLRVGDPVIGQTLFLTLIC